MLNLIAFAHVILWSDAKYATSANSWRKDKAYLFLINTSRYAGVVSPTGVHSKKRISGFGICKDIHDERNEHGTAEASVAIES
jgi:hypothetical protein